MKNLMLLKVNLSLFDGEGGAPAPSGQEGSNEGVADPSNELVLEPYEDDTDDSEESEKPVKKQEKKVDFKELIKGDYKDDFHNHVQSIINERFKDVKAKDKEIESLKRFTSLLQHKYGTDDVEEMFKRFDTEIIEDLAYQNEVSPENYRKMMKGEEVERERVKLEAERQKYEQVQMRVAQWTQQAEQFKLSNPDFDMRSEMQNDKFTSLLNAGLDVATAYEVVHFNDLKTNMAKEIQEQTLESIKSKKTRPVEAANKSSSGLTVKNDVSQLSPEQRREIANRVARGEKITFGK